VLLTWSSTNQTPHNRSHDRVLNRLMHTMVCIIQIVHTFQRPVVVLGKWVALNYLNTSFVCITGLVSSLGQCSNGLERIMHSPSARALSRPRPLLHHLRAQNPVVHTQLVSKYSIKKTCTSLFNLMINVWPLVLIVVIHAFLCWLLHYCYVSIINQLCISTHHSGVYWCIIILLKLLNTTAHFN